jgi:tetratricopeptide (TPR) repeat protein
MSSSNDAARDAVGPVIALENQGQPARALRVVDALLAAAEPSPELIAAKARVLSDLGRHVDALATADFAADIWPGSPTAHAARAEALESADRHHEALAAAERAIAMDALNVAAMRARAQALAATHNVAEALRWARQAADLACNDPLSVATLIMVMLEADPEAAHMEADAYVTRHRDPLALALRSAVRLSLDDADGALADAREATILDPENEAAAFSVWGARTAPEASGR